MIVRELLLGPKRFTDLKTGLPGASPNVLSQRLRELEEAGLVTRRKLPPPAGSRVYELTQWGMELEPVLDALGRWGARAPAPPPEHGMSLDAHILSLRTLFDPTLAGGFSATLDLRLGEQRFRARVDDGRLEIEAGEAQAPDAVIVTDAGTLLAIAHRRQGFKAALRAGELEVDGDRAAAERFLGLFTLPEPALPVST
jgi:DNA-binding HxlR family transcriptional regulator/putative sterol carrier protein